MLLWVAPPIAIIVVTHFHITAHAATVINVNAMGVIVDRISDIIRYAASGGGDVVFFESNLQGQKEIAYFQHVEVF